MKIFYGIMFSSTAMSQIGLQAAKYGFGPDSKAPLHCVQNGTAIVIVVGSETGESRTFVGKFWS